MDASALDNLVDKDAFASLEKRVKDLENDNDENKNRLTTAEEEIEKLRR